MRLRAKILQEYWKELKRGKNDEIRQIEDITLVNSETGEEMTFLVEDVSVITPEAAQTKYPNLPWKPDLPTLELWLGERR